ncbi:MAG TPA: polymorphic toxin-type HINT domain-containing protein, partial [Pirellulales bacterium]|nr:polymorphic toxin-type HINT domain-containing protein [Pirellulales bacterium]
MVANELTFGLTPMNSRVGQMIELNGGLYNYANWGAKLSAMAMWMLVPCGKIATLGKGLGVVSSGNTFCQGVKSGNWWQAGMGIVGMVPLLGSWCFVARTQVVMADSGDDVSASQLDVAVVSSDTAAADDQWLWSVLAVGAGILGYAAAGEIKRRMEDETATRRLFQNLLEDDMLGKGVGRNEQGLPDDQIDDKHQMMCGEAIDELSDALFHGGGIATWQERGAGRRQRELEPALAGGASRMTPQRPIAVAERRPAGTGHRLPDKIPRANVHVDSSVGSRSRLGVAWLAVCLLFAAWLGFRDRSQPQPRTAKSAAARVAAVSGAAALPIDAAETANTRRLRTKSIEDIRVGERVEAGNPTDELDLSLGMEEPDPLTWRKLVLRAPKADGSSSDIELLRPLWWLEAQGAEVGGHTWITVPECGIDSNAELLYVQPCPPIARGRGRVVTGTFAHASAAVLDLSVEGLDEPIGTTANHRFWCEDRQSFVRAVELRVGDELRSLEGSRRVLTVAPRREAERVCNLEVQCEHVYYVGAEGVLVHNACHHPISMFMGGNGAGQVMINLPTAIHVRYHQILSGLLRGGPWPMPPMGGVNGSYAKWQQ